MGNGRPDALASIIAVIMSLRRPNSLHFLFKAAAAGGSTWRRAIQQQVYAVADCAAGPGGRRQTSRQQTSSSSSSESESGPWQCKQALASASRALGLDMEHDECADVIVKVLELRRSKVTLDEATLLKEYNLTPHKIHTVAVLVLYGAAAHGNQDMHFTAVYMLERTISLGYMPSVLTFINTFGIERKDDPASRTIVASFSKLKMNDWAQRALVNYLAESNSSPSESTEVDRDAAQDALVVKANAFTLAGRLATAAGDYARAMRWFQAARVVGNSIALSGSSKTPGTSRDEFADTLPREPRWDWERTCLLSIWELHLQNGNLVTFEEARGALLTAALAINSATACLVLATTNARHGLPDELVDTILQKAAVSGKPEAASLLAVRERMKSGRSGIDAKEQRFHSQLADEWERISHAFA